MKTKNWILILSVLFIALCIASIPLFLPHASAVSAEIWSEGKLITTISLRQDAVIPVRSSRGSNTVTIKDGKISVTQATCPDHYCMERGACDSGADIICLPNQLVIKFTGQSGLDATAG